MMPLPLSLTPTTRTPLPARRRLRPGCSPRGGRGPHPARVGTRTASAWWRRSPELSLRRVILGAVVAGASKDLLSQIQAGALSSETDLPSLLRMCVALGGETKSAALRDWATRELKGYGSGEEVPSYRLVQSFLYLEGAMVGARVSGQQVPLTMIPRWPATDSTAHPGEAASC